MKNKLFIGALSAAIILGGTFTVSALQGQPEPTSVSQSTQAAPLAQPTIVEKPFTDIPQNTSDTITVPEPVKPTTHWTEPSIGYGNTPIPSVEATQPASEHRADGFDNMCYKMDDGSYTTVIIKDYSPSPTIFPYLGEIDVATGAAATAAGSQQWCAANDPARAQ